MNNFVEYKSYIGSIEFDQESNVFYGKVMGIRALISFEGESAKELVEDFHNAVDEYLDMCKSENKMPEKAYKGSFNVRISPELHRLAAINASMNQMTLNSLVEKAIQSYLSK